MSMFTPGPWRAVRWTLDCWFVQSGERDTAQNLAKVDSEGNARLIAEAPELLKIAERLALLTNEGEDVMFGVYMSASGLICAKGSTLALIEDARAAVAKATGEAA